MRRVLILCMLFALLIMACASEAAPTDEPADAGEEPTSMPVSTDSSPEPAPLGPAEETVSQQLAANLGLKGDEIVLISSEETEFSNACLGVTMEGVMCAEVITPGRIIVLEANGVQYEYHTSEDGSRVQPATLALVWKREGGIAGFCDSLTVFRSGEVFTNSCSSQAGGTMSTFADVFSSEETQQFNDWMAKFDEVTLDASDPADVADRMVVTLEIFGSGNVKPAEQEQETLFKFAQDLYQELAPK